MATYKDCLHHEVCYLIEHYGLDPTIEDVELDCDDFKESIRPKGLYNAHEVAEIIADLFGDCCACNFNGIDEWLPKKCELQDACPNPVGVACWEQYLKYREAKMEG